MKKVLLLSVLVIVYLGLKAQKVYFIYLQSENSAPFYVKMGGKIQSSTAEGYLIIPKLTDSVYSITIGQPGKQDEPRFSVTISRGDRGFLIKNNNRPVSLFDLQTLAVYNPITVEGAATQTVSKNDNFTKLLAKATDDTSVLVQPVVMQQKPKPKEPQAEVVVAKEDVAPKKDSVRQVPSPVVSIAASTPPVVLQKDTVVEKKPEVVAAEKPVIKKEEPPAATSEDFKKSTITKKAGSYTPEGLGLVFFDNYDGRIDTIQLLIPNQNSNLSATPQKQPADNKQFLEVNNDQSTKNDSAVVKTPETTTSIKPSDRCKSLSTDDDFFKLRRDMATKNNDDDMIALAKKHFKLKCYRTEQIKFLSTLFLTDQAKYQFFDAAYIYVSDQQRFGSLQSEIKDNYYLNRFKALIAN